MASAVIGLMGRVVWGYVILRLARLGVEHPGHKTFLIELAKSKKVDLPNVTLGKLGKFERTSHERRANQ